MKGEKVLLFLLCAGIELCYLFACSTFVTTAVFHQPFPFPEAVGSFLIAALLFLFCDGRGWRVIYVLGFQALGFIPALLRMINIFNSWSAAFQSQTWFAGYFDKPSDVVEYFVFVLVIAWVLVFWVGGVELVRRDKDYSTICSRFDRGLIVFFILFLTKLYLQITQGIQVSDSTSGFMLFPFLIFSLLAIGLVRTQGVAPREFIPGYQTIGVMLGFVVVILLAGAGGVFFFLPYLTLVAEKGNDILNLVSGPVIAILVGIITWLFGTDFSVSKTLPAQTDNLPDSSVQFSFPWWVELVGKILAVGVVILVAIVLLAIVGGLLYSIFLWLFSRTEFNQKKSSLRDLLSAFFAPLRALARWLSGGRVRSALGYGEAVRLYTALRIWGRHSGSAHFHSETPGEYGLRLARRFPALASEIHLIVGVFNREVYGEIVLDERQLVPARSARRKLGSPFYWHLRLKAWFVR